jgi:hypothetical protein
MDRNVRGRNYNMHKVMELYESGLKPSEIAKRLKIKSVQSLRHAIGRHNREKERTEKIISEITEERKVMQKAEHEKLEEDAKQREMAERQKLIAKIIPPVAGLFSYDIDIQTFKALEFVLKEQWNDSFFINSETQEIYLPENLDTSDVRYELLLSGFFMKITNVPQINKKPLKIGIMHDEFMSEIPLDAQKIDIFFPSVSEDAFRAIKHAFKLFITIGIMKLESLSRIWFSDQISIDQVRGRISKLGYYGEICYDPIKILNEIGKKVLGKHGSSLIIMDNLEDVEIREQILDIWGGFEVKALLNATFKYAMLDEELTLRDAIRPYLKDVFRITLESVGYRKVSIFPEFPGFDNIAGINEKGFLNKLWSVMYDTISDYYVQLHVSRGEDNAMYNECTDQKILS